MGQFEIYKPINRQEINTAVQDTLSIFSYGVQEAFDRFACLCGYSGTVLTVLVNIFYCFERFGTFCRC